MTDKKTHNTNKEKFLRLVSEQDQTALAGIQWRRANRAWLKKSQGIALNILRTLREKQMSQKQLAEALSVSPQQVNKWIKGKENFTLETISKLEAVLATDLLIVPEVSHMNYSKKQSTAFSMPFPVPTSSNNYQYGAKIDGVIPMMCTNPWSKTEQHAS